MADTHQSDTAPDVKCPVCSAPAGSACRTLLSGVRRKPHEWRIELAEAQRDPVRAKSGGDSLPPLGDVDISPKRTCTRLMGRNNDGSERLCDAPAYVHIDWGPYSGFCCTKHWQEVKERGWTLRRWHLLGPNCGMPGALWFDFPTGGSACDYDGGLPAEEPARAVAVEVA